MVCFLCIISRRLFISILIFKFIKLFILIFIFFIKIISYLIFWFWRSITLIKWKNLFLFFTDWGLKIIKWGILFLHDLNIRKFGSNISFKNKVLMNSIISMFIFMNWLVFTLILIGWRRLFYYWAVILQIIDVWILLNISLRDTFLYDSLVLFLIFAWVWQFHEVVIIKYFWVLFLHFKMLILVYVF